jgi:undecaprenyl-diphosphatase
VGVTELVEAGCAVISSGPFARVMEAFGALGDGLAGAGLALLVLVIGFLAHHERTRRAGVAALLALSVAGLLSVLLKALFQMPRPDASSVTFAFPSGHASTAFALTGVLGYAFPAWAPLAFLVAVLAGVARVYHRAHFLIDVGAGALLGTVTGILLARALTGPAPPAGGPRGRAAWALAALAALPFVVFFGAYERTLARHRLADSPQVSSAGVVVRFGTEEAQRYLGQGWSGDERWTEGFPIVWAEGREAGVTLPGLPPIDHRLRLRLHPFVAVGRPSCQTVEVAVNGTSVATIWLDTGWRWYEVPAGAGILREPSNDMRFRFGRAERPSDHGASSDPRRLSVAFAG